MSFFYPHYGFNNRLPAFDHSDQSPYHYSSYPSHHPYSSFDPLCLTHPRDGFGDPYHRFTNLPRARPGRDPCENPHSTHYHNPYRGATSPDPINYEDSIRAERARRLAEAKVRQLAQSKSDDETKVQVTLPDGRQCLVPLSWAKKMQSKYPDILTNSMIRPHRPPSPPIRLDRYSPNDSDHDSDFFVLDPTQDPSVPSLATSSSIPIRQRSPTPPPPRHSPEELDSAAQLIQQQFRLYRSVKNLDQIESTFHQLKSGFTYPSPLDLTFLESPNQSTRATPSKLAFNNPVNRPVQAFEEGLTQLQIKADAVISRGNPKIKNWRKRLIKEIESQLEQLDRFKNEAWTSQKLAHNNSHTEAPGSHPGEGSATNIPLEFQSKSSVSGSHSQDDKSGNMENECGDEEMNEDIVTTDDESMAVDHSNTDSGALSISLGTSTISQPSNGADGNLVIPIAAPLATSLENLVIPTSGLSSSLDQTTCTINPLVTEEGNLVCPTPDPSHDSDDIIVSPI